MRQHRRIGIGRLLQCVGDASVQLLALADEKAFVGRVLNQRVLENISDSIAGSSRKNQLRIHQLLKIIVYGSPVKGPAQQSRSELPADASGCLGDFLDRRKPIQARHERVMQSGWDGQRRQRTIEHIPSV